MRQVIYRTATSFTGFIADEGHSLDWLFAVDHAAAPDHSQFLASVGAIVEGSTTYEWVLKNTDLLAEPGQWQKFYGSRPTFVFTSRKRPVPAGADVRFVRGAVEQALPAIRAAAGDQDIWLAGGGDLAGQSPMWVHLIGSNSPLRRSRSPAGPRSFLAASTPGRRHSSAPSSTGSSFTSPTTLSPLVRRVQREAGAMIGQCHAWTSSE